ncbi:Rv3654c family TadE-like protein [Microbacterium karelineae]|uniref:Rv3654c family TadE-like protein n=1 Tax=Microbacterium karelineae TaxID=2654283 RepID=UPI0012EA1B78|nr:Rv3654c family TadE-like protein [Microbacterium karelineae]
MGASVVTAAAIGVAASLAVGCAVVGAAATESQRAAGIADAAALAAADALSGFAAGEPCARAAAVADAQGAGVRSCEVVGREATIEISTGFAGLPVIAIARAGPPPGGASLFDAQADP